MTLRGRSLCARPVDAGRISRLQRHSVRAARRLAGGAAHRSCRRTPPVFTGVFMERMVGFLKLYFPVFLLGAVFGKLIELAGFSQSIAAAVIRLVGEQRAMLSIVLVCALLTYGGVSLFVVVFAVYPFAAEMFRRGRYSEAPHSRARSRSARSRSRWIRCRARRRSRTSFRRRSSARTPGPRRRSA